MKEVSAGLPPLVQVLDPGTEDPLDELQDTLVLMQEDELPQGVLELMANLILRHRPVMQSGHAVTWHTPFGDQEMPAVKRDEGPSPASVGVAYPQANAMPNKPIPNLKPQRVSTLMPQPVPLVTPLAAQPVPLITPPAAQPVPLIPPPAAQPMSSAIRVESVLVERPVSNIEPLPIERAVGSVAPLAASTEMQLPDTLLNAQAARHLPQVAQPPVSSPAMLQPMPAPDAVPETFEGAEHGLLQVPFNRGAASGQVTISRMADEPTRNLLLSPSNALVFDQIRTALDLTGEPGWQLTDSDDEQQGRGSHQSPDEGQVEQQDHPA